MSVPYYPMNKTDRSVDFNYYKSYYHMQMHNCPAAGSKPQVPITSQLKKQIIDYLQRIPLNTAWGFTAKDFHENRDAKSNSDYQELLYELGADIQDGPGTMQQILGPAYNFFRKLIL